MDPHPADRRMEKGRRARSGEAAHGIPAPRRL